MYVACMGRGGGIQGSVEKPTRKRPLGNPRRRWEDNKMNLKEIGWEPVCWIRLPQHKDRKRVLVDTNGF
jgi:hypothetical protein